MESSNSNASIDNSTDDNNMMMNGGINDQQPTSNSSTAAITSFANLGKFFSNFNSSSPLSRRNSFSTNNFAGNKFDGIKPYNGKSFLIDHLNRTNLFKFIAIYNENKIQTQ